MASSIDQKMADEAQNHEQAPSAIDHLLDPDEGLNEEERAAAVHSTIQKNFRISKS